MPVSVSINVTGTDEVIKKLEKIENLDFKDAVEKGAKHVYDFVVDVVPVDTEDLKKGVKMSTSLLKRGAAAKIEFGEHYSIYQEYGYVMTKGQIFYSKSRGWQTVTNTHFVPGHHFVKYSVMYRTSDVIDEIVELIRSELQS